MASPERREAGARRVIADNRKARFNYEIVSTIEAGIQLTGSEVKSLRTGKASLGEAYATEQRGELYLINAHIPEYDAANRLNHHPRRQRKLLVHKREIERLARAVQAEGMTLVPLRLYFNDRGMAKLELALARGKKLHDKREAEKHRDWQRDKARLLRERG
jgi:SsrA-binding protein